MAVAAVIFAGAGHSQETGATEEVGMPLPDWLDARWAELSTGEAVLLTHRPDEKEDAIDKRFVNYAILVEAPFAQVWEVVNDKNAAADFMEGVLFSEIKEQEDNEILLEQKTKVGGPKESYHYFVRHFLFRDERYVNFEHAGGELRDILGGWWFYEGKDPGTTVLVYSLHIDAAAFAPQFIVKRGMRKSIPRTMNQMRDESERRLAEKNGEKNGEKNAEKEEAASE